MDLTSKAMLGNDPDDDDSNSDDEWGSVIVATGAAASSSIRVKNDPDKVKKVSAKVTRGLSDMNTAKYQLKRYLKSIKDEPNSELIRSKLNDGPEKIQAALDYYESLDSYDF
eukprot:14048038-Alexandrium_andersonii.AAC.1